MRSQFQAKQRSKFVKETDIPISVDEKPPGADENLRVIGVPRRRVDARAKVTGQTRFADDIFLPRMTYCKLLRSPHAHARIRGIDVSRAAVHPGVYLVLTGKDLPTHYGILPISEDEQALCLDHVRHVGDPVAAVIAREELTAFEAMDLIDVDYEVLATISSPEEALATPYPRIHEYGEEGNIHKRVALEFGDVEQGFREADEVFEDVFFFQGNTHLPIEQHASVAIKDPEGKLTIWSSTQTPHYLHKALAKVLAMPAAHIRVIATPNGGGFGGKSDPFNHEIVVSKAALMLDRPVKICLTREEVFYCHRGRHPVLMKFKTGVKKNGTITGMHLQTLIDGGAYGSYGVASTFYTGALATTTYHIPRYHFQGCRTFTNKPPCGPKRGHGTVQPRFGQEVQLDKIAEKLAIDPADLRLRIVESPTPRPRIFSSLAPWNWPHAFAGSWKSPVGARNFASCRTAAASDWPVPRISRERDCLFTGIPCRTRAFNSSSTAAVASRFFPARRKSARDPMTCWHPSSPKSWEFSRLIFASSRATRTSVRWTWVLTRAV